MNKLIIGLSLFLAGSGAAQAQYYYKDIVSNKQVIADLASYREARIRTIKIKSFESNGEPSEGFFCEKKVAKDYKKTALYTRSDMSGNSLLESYFNESGKLIKSYDSSSISMSSSEYSYDDAGRLIKIVSISKSNDDDFVNELREEHLYEYNENNQPLKMTLVKNKYDSIAILFSLDENGNVTIEKNTKSGAKYYYYYDAQKRLTDVVHANEYKQGLVADYLFEYNPAGLLSQMTTTEEGGNNYYVWKYTYDNGLRIKERVYSKDRRLMGSIEYEYK